MIIVHVLCTLYLRGGDNRVMRATQQPREPHNNPPKQNFIPTHCFEPYPFSYTKILWRPNRGSLHHIQSIHCNSMLFRRPKTINTSYWPHTYKH